MPVSSEALRYAIRPLPVLRLLGTLFLAMTVIVSVPLLVAVFSGSYAIAVRYLVVLVAAALAGKLLHRLPKAGELRPNEAFVLACVMYLITPLAMAYPMSGAGIPFLDAWFEAVSGATTTGLSTLASVENTDVAFLFGRAWMQWYGGLGFVILSLALVLRPGQAARSLALTESDSEDLLGGARGYARRVLAIYLILTVLAVILVWASGMGAVSFFDALLYSLAAVSTGGYAPHDASLASLQGYLPQAMVMLFCLAGALPLMLYRKSYRRQKGMHVNRIQLLLLLGLCLASALAITLSLKLPGGSAATDMEWGQALWHGPMLALSAQSTAGFSTMDVGQTGAGAKVICVFSMLTGGGTGSTAGGFKVLRLCIFFLAVLAIIRRTCLSPNAVQQPSLANKRLAESEMREALAVIILYVLALFFSWLPFIMAGYAPLDALFEVASALGTVGLSTGITGADLSPLLKVTLCVDMLLGRLEILAWLVFIYPGTWIGRRN